MKATLESVLAEVYDSVKPELKSKQVTGFLCAFYDEGSGFYLCAGSSQTQNLALCTEALNLVVGHVLEQQPKSDTDGLAELMALLSAKPEGGVN